MPIPSNFDPVDDRPDNVPRNAFWCWDHSQYHGDYDNWNAQGQRLDDYGDPYNEDDDDEIEDDDDYYDEDDSRENETRGLVHSYSYKPDPIFLGTGPLFLGSEIEVECRKRASTARAALKHLSRDMAEGIGYLKSDGSLTNGIEIVTHPMTYAWAIDHFPWDMFSELDSLGAYAEPEHCGLHVHVSRKGFRSQAHALQWFRFFYAHEQQICTFARRRSDQWATFARRPGDLVHAIKGDMYQDRYRAINVQNYNTYEVRVFGSSTSADMVKATLGFIDASVRYAGVLCSNDVLTKKRGTWPDFIDYVTSHDCYQPLTGQLDDLGLLPVPAFA
jgi:hypothetical protein